MLRYSVSHFLGALALMIVAMPFVEDIEGGLWEPILFSLVLLSGVLAVGARRSTLIGAAVFAIVALVGKWMSPLHAANLPEGYIAIAALLFVGFLIVHLFRYIVRAPVVDSEVIAAGIAIYLLLGLIWSIAYMLVARLNPDAFVIAVGPDSERTMNRSRALYFSFVTLSTVGYGDIVPVSKAARVLAITEATTGLFYLGVLIARLVSAYAPPARSGR